MANIKVSGMTEATSFDNGDYTMIVQANQNKKISKENMLSDIPTIQNDISTINTNIGTLSNLKTEDKSSIVNSINELKEREIYSFNEIKTNKVWIDSNNVEHPIYRKTIDFGYLPNNSLKSVSSGLSNVIIRDMHGTARNSLGSTITIPEANGSNTVRLVYTANNEVQIATTYDRSGFYGEVDLEYRKQND